MGHWVTIFKTDNGVYFVDSFGFSPKFYKKNIGNKHVKISHYLSKKLQNNYTTICGGYAVFFIHGIVKCNYRIACFMKMMKDNFLFKRKNNDKTIVEYILKYTSIKPDQCVNYFCSKKFNIDYNKCLNKICQPNNI